MWKITSAFKTNAEVFVCNWAVLKLQITFLARRCNLEQGQISRFIKETLRFYAVENYLGVCFFKRRGILLQLSCFEMANYLFGAENYLGVFFFITPR